MGWGSRKTHVRLERLTYMRAWRPFTSAGFTCRTFIEQQWCTWYMDMWSSYLEYSVFACNFRTSQTCRQLADHFYGCSLQRASARLSRLGIRRASRAYRERARALIDRTLAGPASQNILSQSSGQSGVDGLRDSRRSRRAYCKRSMFSVESGRQKERPCFAIAKLST